MKTILFIHGFASSSQGQKANHLKSIPKIKAIVPDLPVSPKDAIALLTDIIKKENPDKLHLLGSSLGGFYAYYLTFKFRIKSTLINPSMFPVETTRNYIGTHERWGTSEIFEWTQDHVNELQELFDEIMISLGRMNSKDVSIYLAIHDEVLNIEKIKNFFNGYSVKLIDTDHRFGLEEFKKLLSEEFMIE